MNYEEEWEADEEEGADIGGIWQVVKGRKTARKELGRECMDKTSKRRYSNRWEALEDDEEEDIMHLREDHTGCEEVKITIDSGAVDTVGPNCVGMGFPVQPTEASKKGMFYRAANNTKIAIHGKKALRGYTNERYEIGLGIRDWLGHADRGRRKGIRVSEENV